jgi:hypothetical protein
MLHVLRILLLVQACYYFLTALWPIVHIESFMDVTGYKIDQWLVKTVGALLIPVSLTLGSYLFIKTDKGPAIILGGGCAIAFSCIDFYYTLSGTISSVYLLDGVLELFLLLGWINVTFGYLKQSTKKERGFLAPF